MAAVSIASVLHVVQRFGKQRLVVASVVENVDDTHDVAAYAVGDQRTLFTNNRAVLFDWLKSRTRS